VVVLKLRAVPSCADLVQLSIGTNTRDGADVLCGDRGGRARPLFQGVFQICPGKMRVCRLKAAKWRRGTGLGVFSQPSPLERSSSEFGQMVALSLGDGADLLLGDRGGPARPLFQGPPSSFFLLLSSPKLSDTQVYEP